MENGDADATYEYTGTAWITYLGHGEPIPDPHEQWEAVRKEDLAAAMLRGRLSDRGSSEAPPIAPMAEPPVLVDVTT